MMGFEVQPKLSTKIYFLIVFRYSIDDRVSGSTKNYQKI